MSAEDKNKARQAGAAPSLEPDDDEIIDVDLNDKVGDDSKSQATAFEIDEQPTTSGSGRSKGSLLSGVRTKAADAVNKAKGVLTKSRQTNEGTPKSPAESPSSANLNELHKPTVVPRKLWLTNKAVDRPVLVIVATFLLSLILSIVAFAVYPPKVDLYESSDAFTIGQHPAVEAHRTAVSFYNTVSLYSNAAQFSQFVRRSAHPITPRSTAPLPTQLLIVYKAKSGSSVLSPENLENARRLEAYITSHPTYQRLCTRVGFQCQPPTSAVSYFFPSVGANGMPVYDGKGEVTRNIQLTTQRIMTSAGPEPAQWYFEPWSNAAKPESRILRSAFLLGQPGQGQGQYKEILKFIKSIRGRMRSYDTDSMMVVWAQKEVLSAELNEALLHDSLLILVAACIIFIFLWILLESLFLAVMGLITIILSMGLAYFVYAVILQTHYFGAVNLLVIFVCLGIAVDDLFVVVNAFKHTKDMYEGKENAPTDPDEILRFRLGTSVRKSASAVFLTSFTTAASVLTNMLSPLKGVRTFVLFMALIVMMCYVVTMLAFPAVIVIWARRYEDKPSRLGKKFANMPSLQAWFTNHLESRHVPFFAGTPLRRAITLLAFMVVVVISIGLVTQLKVTGAELQILAKGKNYQRWIEVRNYYGDTSTTACQSCGSIGPALVAQDTALGTVALSSQQLAGAMVGSWVPPTPTTSSMVVITPTVPVVADMPLKPAINTSPQTQAAPVALPSTSTSVPVTAQATVQTTTTSAGMPTATPLPGDCNSKAVNAAAKVLGLCGDALFVRGQCLMSCAMGVSQKMDWALEQCETVHSDVQLIKDQMLRVYLTWGLKGYEYASDKPKEEKNLVPVFDDRFDFYDPNTQLDMLSVCNYLRQNRQFSQDHPDAVRCFVEDLQAWLQARGQSLPLTGSRAAQSMLLMQFLNDYPVLRTYVLWRVSPSPSNRRQTSTAYVGAVNVLVWTPRREGEDAADLHDYYTQWNTLIDESNARSGARFWGRQSAKNWEMVITKMSTVNGIAWSIGLSAMIAALSLLLFSQSPRITVYSMVCLLSNTIIVLALVRCFNWSIGMLEALSLSILLGLAVDYLLHVSEEYLGLVTGSANVQSRYIAVRHAVGSIGVSVVYSAVTTCASVLVLVFASFDMIKKMGLIIFFALMLSIIIALIPFPAVLAWIGPWGFKRSWRRAALCLVGAAVLALLIVAILYIAHAAGAVILAPSGNPMFG